MTVSTSESYTMRLWIQDQAGEAAPLLSQPVRPPPALRWQKEAGTMQRMLH